MNLSGYRRPDIFKKNYPDFNQNFPNVTEGKTSGSLLENDCLPSRRYQKYLSDIKRNEGIGYIDNPRLIDQPTMTGLPDIKNIPGNFKFPGIFLVIKH